MRVCGGYGCSHNSRNVNSAAVRRTHEPKSGHLQRYGYAVGIAAVSEMVIVLVVAPLLLRPKATLLQRIAENDKTTISKSQSAVGILRSTIAVMLAIHMMTAVLALWALRRRSSLSLLPQYVFGACLIIAYAHFVLWTFSGGQAKHGHVRLHATVVACVVIAAKVGQIVLGRRYIQCLKREADASTFAFARPSFVTMQRRVVMPRNHDDQRELSAESLVMSRSRRQRPIPMPQSLMDGGTTTGSDERQWPIIAGVDDYFEAMESRSNLAQSPPTYSQVVSLSPPTYSEIVLPPPNYSSVAVVVER